MARKCSHLVRSGAARVRMICVCVMKILSPLCVLEVYTVKVHMFVVYIYDICV